MAQVYCRIPRSPSDKPDIAREKRYSSYDQDLEVNEVLVGLACIANALRSARLVFGRTLPLILPRELRISYPYSLLTPPFPLFPPVRYAPPSCAAQIQQTTAPLAPPAPPSSPLTPLSPPSPLAQNPTINMISARTVLLLALVLACASSFGIPAAKVASKAAANSGVSFMKSASIAAPVALVASPAFAMMELPTQTLSLEVQVSQRNETKRQRLVDSSPLHMT